VVNVLRYRRADIRVRIFMFWYKLGIRHPKGHRHATTERGLHKEFQERCIRASWLQIPAYHITRVSIITPRQFRQTDSLPIEGQSAKLQRKIALILRRFRKVLENTADDGAGHRRGSGGIKQPR
jgi:hypothetical protein